MVEEKTSRQSQSRVAVVFGVVFGILAFSAFVGGLLSVEFLQKLAGKIRAPRDFTLERYQRYLHICWFFAVSVGICSVGCLLFREKIQQQYTLLGTQLRALPGGMRRFFCNIPRAVWISLLLGIGVRVWFLNLPMAYDEAYSFINYASRPFYLGIADYNESNNHLFNTLLMHGMFRLFGQQDWALRIPVFCFGIAILPIVWGWAKDRFSESVAAVAVALVAISPALVSYSVNARGYLYLTCCTVLLDWALFHIVSSSENKLAWWCVAWIATVVGAWSMPLMVYPAFGLFGWFVAGPNVSRQKGVHRLRELLPFGITVVIAVAVFYAPAYLLRGLMFLERAGFEESSFGVWLARLPEVLGHAAQTWLAVPWPVQSLAVVCILIGLVGIARERTHLYPLLAPFAAALLLIGLQQVSPPPRIFLYLAPWALLFCARGLVMLVERLSSQKLTSTVLATVIVLSGTAYLVGKPYLFEEHERRDYASIPAVIERLQAELSESSGLHHRLFAPLPCDIPALYYMDKLGFRIPVNGNPLPHESLWLIARPEQSPAKTLSTPLIGLSALSDEIGPWETVAEFDTLVLYRSSRPVQPENASGF